MTDLTAVTMSPPQPVADSFENGSDDDEDVSLADGNKVNDSGQEATKTAYSLFERAASSRRTFGKIVDEEDYFVSTVNTTTSTILATDQPLAVLTAESTSLLAKNTTTKTGPSVFDSLSDQGEEEEEEQEEMEQPLDAQPESGSQATLSAEKSSFVEQNADQHKNDGDDDDRIKDKMEDAKTISASPVDDAVEQTDVPAGDASSQLPPEATAATTGKEGQPDAETLTAKTDILFESVADKQAVTVKQIMQALQEDFADVKLNKVSKSVVRDRLIDLINQEAGNEADDDDEEEEAEEESVVGDAESSESEAEPEEADDEDDYSTNKKQKNRPRASRKKASSSVTKKPKGPSNNKRVANKAARVHAEQVRKKRVEQLRVRNEELQLNQSKEDQERAEQIAAKFDTNTDEMLKQRTHHRLNLLQKLDKKRIAVVQESKFNDENDSDKDDEENQEEDSDDDMELEFVGQTRQIELNLPKSNALTLLNLNDRVRQRLADAKGKPSKPRSSPGRSMRARAALKHNLLSRQRRIGNLWLARELGYKTEKDHLRDCRESEERKRVSTLQREEERMKLSERRQDRERKLALGEVDEDDQEPDQSKEESNNVMENDQEEEEEEDEEMEMAKALEQEASEGAVNAFTEEDGLAAQDVETSDTAVAEDSACTDGPWASESNADEESHASGPRNTTSAIATSDESSANESAAATTDPASKGATLDGKSFNPGADELLVANASPKETTFDDSDNDEIVAKSEPAPKKTGPRNAAWKAMLKKDAEKAKKQKKRKGGLLDEEAEEEEEEEVAGLEEFGFTVQKKKDGEEDEAGDDELDEDDLKHVVDDLSDDEGDEDAGDEARKTLEREREKELHKEAMRRMRDGYDGRRGGIAVGGAGARGMHRFDQLVAADNREDAKRLGLLNDDEMDSDNEGDKAKGDDDEDDEAALLDKMLKDRFLHRSNVDLEENFSDDEEEEVAEVEGMGSQEPDDAEDKEQEKLAKRFAKRARMQRLVETYGHEEEFSQSRLIDEDTSMKAELQRMKNGLCRKRSVMSEVSNLSVASSAIPASKRQKPAPAGGFLGTGSSLSLALQASRRNKNRTTFVRNGSTSNDASAASLQKNIAFNHVVFHSNSASNMSSSSKGASRGALGRQPTSHNRFPGGKSSKSASRSTSLWSKVVSTGFQKRTKK